MADTTINSTPTLSATTTFNGVTTTMDTAQLTLLNPNLATVVPAVALTALSTGFYQYTLALGTLTVPGNWSAVWYFQRGQQSNQVTQVIVVGS